MPSSYMQNDNTYIGEFVLYRNLSKNRIEGWHIPDMDTRQPSATVDITQPPHFTGKHQNITHPACIYLRDLGYTGPVHFIRISDMLITFSVHDLVKYASTRTTGSCR